jgi:ABC-2 type transport system permease protein
MINLIRIEWKKIATYKTFWVFLFIYLGIFGLVFAGIESILNGISTDVSQQTDIGIPSFSVYAFPHIWHNLTFLAGYFKIIPALLLVVLITNEFGYKTIRLNICSGLSREQFVYGKLILSFELSLLSTVFVFLSGMVLGLLNSPDLQIAEIFQEIQFLGAFLIELNVFLLFALMIAFLLKKSGFTIATLLLYNFVVEPIIAHYLPGNWERILPLRAAGNLIDVPNTSLMQVFGIQFRNSINWQDLVVSLVFGLIFSLIAILYIRKTNL